MLDDRLPRWNELTIPEKEQLIAPLWIERGLSCGQIAFKFIGASRNAVIGVISRARKAGRNGFDTVPANVIAARVKRGHVRKSTAHRHKAKPATPRKPRQHQAFIPPPIAEPYRGWDELREPLPEIPPISIIDLPNRPGVRCRFMVVGGYCGADCGESMYCPTHRGYVYNLRT